MPRSDQTPDGEEQVGQPRRPADVPGNRADACTGILYNNKPISTSTRQWNLFCAIFLAFQEIMLRKQHITLIKNFSHSGININHIFESLPYCLQTRAREPRRQNILFPCCRFVLSRVTASVT